jgi:hypothetical protein
MNTAANPGNPAKIHPETTALVHFNHSEIGGLTTWPDMRTSAWKPNYGDMLVCGSILRQLRLGKTVRVGFGYAPKVPVSRAIVRGSTYLHRNFDFVAANKTLDALNVPLAIVGLGAQNPEADMTFLDTHRPAHDFIARLNDRSASISVRGAFSAAVVERLGGRNIRVTGCPSMFYTLTTPKVRLPELLSHAERSIGVSIHSGLTKNIFCRSPEDSRRKHGEAILWAINNAVQVSLFEQGVVLEYTVADRDLPFDDRRAAAAEVIRRIGAEGRISPERLMAHMVSVKNIEEWLAKARDLDAIIGFRFHGNMVALLQGRPCLFLTYDSRLEEFCQLYGLPWRDVRADWEDPVRVMLDHDWEDTNRCIALMSSELKAFYTENGFEALF